MTRIADDFASIKRAMERLDKPEVEYRPFENLTPEIMQAAYDWVMTHDIDGAPYQPPLNPPVPRVLKVCNCGRKDCFYCMGYARSLDTGYHIDYSKGK